MQTTESGIPPPFRATVRCSRIHLGFRPRSATRIGQLSLVPFVAINSLRYIVPWLLSSADAVSDATHDAFCRKIHHHANRRCPKSSRFIAFQFVTESQPCSIHKTTRFHTYNFMFQIPSEKWIYMLLLFSHQLAQSSPWSQRTGSSHSGAEEYPRGNTQTNVGHAYITVG